MDKLYKVVSHEGEYDVLVFFKAKSEAEDFRSYLEFQMLEDGEEDVDACFEVEEATESEVGDSPVYGTAQDAIEDGVAEL